MAAFILSLREGLEAALVVSILLGALRRLGRTHLQRFVWYGVVAAGAASAAFALGLATANLELKGSAEQTFEGVMLILAAAFLTAMIFWVQRQGAHLRTALEVTASTKSSGWSLFGGVFLAVVREGIELALLLVATSFTGSQSGSGLGAALGIGTAALFGLLLYRGALRLNLGVFFRATSILLLFFAAGMTGLGVRELIDAGLLPALVVPLWDLNPILSGESVPGQLLTGLFGYDAAPALTQVLAYLLYLAGFGWLMAASRRRRPIGR